MQEEDDDSATTAAEERATPKDTARQRAYNNNNKRSRRVRKHHGPERTRQCGRYLPRRHSIKMLSKVADREGWRGGPPTRTSNKEGDLRGGGGGRGGRQGILKDAVPPTRGKGEASHGAVGPKKDQGRPCSGPGPSLPSPRSLAPPRPTANALENVTFRPAYTRSSFLLLIPVGPTGPASVSDAISLDGG